MKKNVFAIDGLVASGKGTIAKKIAKHFNIPYLNTGALYRAIGYGLHKANFDNFFDIESIINIAKKIDFNDLENPEFFNEEIGIMASQVAKIQAVRDFLLEYQHDFCNIEGGAVLDGRDIGTIICPDAQYKFYIVASLEERAKRRLKEAKIKDNSVTYENILEKIKNRDFNDLNRAIAPLKKADDAIEIDTTNMNPDQVLEIILEIVGVK